MAGCRSARFNWRLRAKPSWNESSTQELSTRVAIRQLTQSCHTAGWKLPLWVEDMQLWKQSVDTAAKALQIRNSLSVGIFFSAWKSFMMWSVMLRWSLKIKPVSYLVPLSCFVAIVYAPFIKAHEALTCRWLQTQFRAELRWVNMSLELPTRRHVRRKELVLHISVKLLPSQHCLAPQGLCAIEWGWSQAQQCGRGKTPNYFEGLWNSPEVIYCCIVLSYS